MICRFYTHIVCVRAYMCGLRLDERGGKLRRRKALSGNVRLLPKKISALSKTAVAVKDIKASLERYYPRLALFVGYVGFYGLLARGIVKTRTCARASCICMSFNLEYLQRLSYFFFLRRRSRLSCRGKPILRADTFYHVGKERRCATVRSRVTRTKSVQCRAR